MRRPVLSVVVLVLLALPLGRQAFRFHELNSGDAISGQRRLIDAVREVFPEPVP